MHNSKAGTTALVALWSAPTFIGQAPAVAKQPRGAATDVSQETFQAAVKKMTAAVTVLNGPRTSGGQIFGGVSRKVAVGDVRTKSFQRATSQSSDPAIHRTARLSRGVTCARSIVCR